MRNHPNHGQPLPLEWGVGRFCLYLLNAYVYFRFGRNFMTLRGYVLTFMWKPRIPYCEGDILDRAWGFDLRFGWPLKIYRLRPGWAWGEVVHWSEDWTGRPWKTEIEWQPPVTATLWTSPGCKWPA